MRLRLWRINLLCGVMLTMVLVAAGFGAVTPVLGEPNDLSSPHTETIRYQVGSNPGLIQTNSINARGNTDFRTRWTVSSDQFITKVGIAKETVYFGAFDADESTKSQMYAVDAASGEINWQVALRGEDDKPQRPFFYRNTIYFSAVFGPNYALNADTGAERWAKGVPGREKMGAVTNKTVYLGSRFHHPRAQVYALDYVTNDARWTYTVRGKWASAPAVKGDTVYVGTRNGPRDGDHNGAVYALAAGTGEVRWSFNTNDFQAQHLTVDEGIVYVATKEVIQDGEYEFHNEGEVFALDAATGQKRWSVSTNSPASGLRVDNGSLYFNSIGDRTYAVDATTGAKRWSFALPDDRTRPPDVAAGSVYVGSGQTVYVLDATTGDKQATFARDNRLIAGPTVVQDTLYVAYGNVDTATSTMYALSMSATPETTPTPTKTPPTPPSQKTTTSTPRSQSPTAQSGSETNGNPQRSPTTTRTGTETGTATTGSTAPGFGLGVGIVALLLALEVFVRRRT